MKRNAILPEITAAVKKQFDVTAQSVLSALWPLQSTHATAEYSSAGFRMMLIL
jgi:hypothetical protein